MSDSGLKTGNSQSEQMLSALRKSGRRADVDAAQASVNIDGGDVAELGLVFDKVEAQPTEIGGPRKSRWKMPRNQQSGRPLERATRWSEL
jgi:hypothetical protein